MPLILDNAPEQRVPAKIKISSFTVNVDSSTIIIVYNLLTDTDELVEKKMLTLTGQTFVDTIAEASSIAGSDIFAALKESLYNQLVTSTGLTGTLT